MDGSQLPTEWTHLGSNLVAGVSDSKKRDVSIHKSGTASKKGPMAKNSKDVTKMSDVLIMPSTSKKSSMAKESESATNR